jgi:hypothetical protein
MRLGKSIEHASVQRVLREDVDKALVFAKQLLREKNQPQDMLKRDIERLEAAKARGATANDGHLYQVKIRGKADEYPEYVGPQGAEAKAFAEQARAAGARGIRFLDQVSRERGEGTYNYVVFNPEDVTVVSRNGEPIVKPEAPARPMDDSADVEASALADRAALKADDIEQVAADTDFLDQQIDGMKSREMWSAADEAALAMGEVNAKKLETTATVYRAAAVCMTE